MSQSLPHGAYTTFRTYEGRKAIRLDEHFDRLEKTARLTGHSHELNRGTVRNCLRELIVQTGGGDKRIRLTLDLSVRPGDLYITIENLVVPSSCDYECGVIAVTRCLFRNNPEAKLTNFIATAADVRAELPPGINEALMIGKDGSMLEGLSSNYFAIQAGQLWTADEGVLNGITREMVLEEAENIGIPVKREGIPVKRLPNIDEAFITSSSRGVLPVVRIDEQRLGNGKPGPVTKRLLGEYRQKVDREAESI